MADDGSQQRKPDFRTAVADAKALVTWIAIEAQSVLGRRTARVLGVLVLFAVVVGLLDWYIAPSSAAEKQALVVTLAQILGGTALLSGLYFTWRTLQVNREGQITERFTRAIDQLGKVDNEGNKLFEIRVGGIYALERIARESEEDYWPIMEILTAYVRQHAPRRPEEGLRGLRDLGDLEVATEVPYPSPDIQAIMTVLRRRTGYFFHGESRNLDLYGTNLSHADFMGANLSYADFAMANLLYASFFESDLYSAELSGADLWFANLSGANLRGANLRGADLRGVDLSGANHLTQEQLEQAEGDDYTQLPPHLKPPAHWSLKTDEQPEED